MKRKIKWILSALVLVGIIAGAAVLYNHLSKENEAQSLAPTAPTDSTVQNEDYTAPDFTVLDANGNKVKLSDFKGQPVVLNFWATWCYYCKEEMPDFEIAANNHPDIQFMMINATDGVQETMETAKAYIKEKGFEFDVFYDTELQAVNAYYVSSFPTTFFVDKNGELVTYANGMLDLETLEKGISYIK